MDPKLLEILASIGINEETAAKQLEELKKLIAELILLRAKKVNPDLNAAAEPIWEEIGKFYTFEEFETMSQGEAEMAVKEYLDSLGQTLSPIHQKEFRDKLLALGQEMYPAR